MNFGESPLILFQWALSPVSSPRLTIRDWNSLTDSLISASECAEDSVTKFISLVRAGD